MNEEETRARARAQYFGPDMLHAIAATIARVESEIREARAMKAGEVTELLLSILAPLREIHERVTETDGEAPD